MVPNKYWLSRKDFTFFVSCSFDVTAVVRPSGFGFSCDKLDEVGRC